MLKKYDRGMCEQKQETYKRAFDEILEQIKVAQVHVCAFYFYLFIY